MNTPVLKNDDTPGHLARRFQQIAVAAFQAEMDSIGSDVTPVQFATMAALAEQPRIDQATLAAKIAVDRATITGVVDRLEAKGLVERKVSPTDRRARELDLSPAGLETLNSISPHVDKAQKTIIRHLSTSEADMLVTLLKKVIAHSPLRRDANLVTAA